MAPTDQAALTSFLIYVAKNGYGNDASQKVACDDGSTTITLSDGAWSFHDNYFTSRDQTRFHGREVISRDGTPTWFLAYSGFVRHEAKPGEVYTFLKQALRHPDANLPIRGPLDYLDEAWHYTLQPSAGLDEFFAIERITKDDVEAYVAYLTGGLIA
jgi:hypothetical protein